MTYRIQEVEFIKSSTDHTQCPGASLPEYAFVGRSNVGKSSLINLITERKNLAKTSGEPGRTRLINHFLIDHSWYLVDLPGYGYAKVSKAERNKFRFLIEQYLLHRESLVCLFVLIDSRHRPRENDLDFIRWLGHQHIPFALCFTKTDKISNITQSKNFSVYRNTLLQEWESLPPVFFTSVTRKTGREEILEFINTTNKNIMIK